MKRVLGWALVAFSLHTQADAERYSVITLPMLQPVTNLTDFLDAAKARGFNTIALPVNPDYMENTGSYLSLTNDGYLSNTTFRNNYKAMYRQILTHSGNFRLMVRIWTNPESMANADKNRQLKWGNNVAPNDFFLAYDPNKVNDPVNTPTTQKLPDEDPTRPTGAPSGEPWINGVDFYTGSNVSSLNHRTRLLNFNNATVWPVVRDVWTAVIRDVVGVANSVGAQNRIVSFTWNTTRMAESEYWWDSFVGNSTTNRGKLNPLFNSPNNDVNRINWINQWQNDLGNWHKTLSNLVVSERNTAGSQFHFTFGAQFSAAYDANGLKRGTFNLASLASKLNPGDWISNADLADAYYRNYNHNFSTDYYQSIAATYGVRVSNECSWATFLEGAPFFATPAQANAAYTQQAMRSYQHGAEAFMVSNFSPADIKNTDWDGFLTYVKNAYALTNNQPLPSRNQAIFVDPWDVYTTEAAGNAVNTNLYDAFGPLYESLSGSGATPIQIIMPQMLQDRPTLLNGIKKINIPGLNGVLSENARILLTSNGNQKKLVLGNNSVGSLNEYQNPAVTLSSMKASDLLWVDKNNKYVGDVSPDLPGLQVVGSNGSGFGYASMWCSWGGLATSAGHYVGDFNGDGKDDFLNFNSVGGLEVVTSAGLSGFTALQPWGDWGADGADIRIGDFNGDGKSDILWVDKTNKFANDATPDVPGLQVKLSTGSNFGSAKLWSGWGGLTTSRGFYVGDFNGDGKDDFLNLTSDGHLQVVISNGSGFNALVDWGTWDVDGADLRIGDFNGDGKADLLWVDKNNKIAGDVSPDDPGLQVRLSNGSGFLPATLWASWGGLATSQGFYVGDFDGDGVSDFMNFASNYELQVVRSNHSNSFSSYQVWGGWGADAGDLLVGNFGNPFGAILTKSAPITNFSGGDRNFTLTVPSGANNVTISISGGTGNADLYVRYGNPVSTSSYDCHPGLSGNNESCVLAKGPGTYYILTHQVSPYTVSTLSASY